VIPTEEPTPVHSSSPTSRQPTVAPTGIPTIQTSPIPTESSTNAPTENPTDAATNNPTDIPTPSPTTREPTPSPSVSLPITRYMAFVNITTFDSPKAVSWRIIDSVSKEQYYGYPAGNYKETGSVVNFMTINTGTWEFQLNRNSASAHAMAKIGTVNTVTGEAEPLGELVLTPESKTKTASTTFRLQ